jgi:3-mercaptopyruvate sulfurtransferase SseA
MEPNDDCQFLSARSTPNVSLVSTEGTQLDLEVVDVDEVRELVRDTTVLIADVRDPADFARRHLPGARWLDGERYSRAALPEVRDLTVVFYGDESSATLARLAAWRAVGFGHTDVRLFLGGMEEWEANGLPTVFRRAAG